MSSHLQVICCPEITAGEDGLLCQQRIAEELTSESAGPKLLIWRCVPTLFVSRSETRLRRFGEAVAHLRGLGWSVVVRKSGGTACPAGPGTVQLSLVEVAPAVVEMNAKYAALAYFIRHTLSRYLHIDAQIAPVSGAYCPGRYDLAVDGKKIAGLSQHWFRNAGGIRCVVTAASINIEEAADLLARIVNQFYACTGSAVSCEPAMLTNVRVCSAKAKLPSADSPSVVMNQFAASAERFADAISEQFSNPIPARDRIHWCAMQHRNS